MDCIRLWTWSIDPRCLSLAYVQLMWMPVAEGVEAQPPKGDIVRRIEAYPERNTQCPNVPNETSFPLL